MPTLAEVPDGEKALTSREARRRLHNCVRAQLAGHVASGALTPYRESAREDVHCRIFYLESEVDSLAKRWKPKKRKRLAKIETNQHDDRIAVVAIPLILEGRPLAEICLAACAHPKRIQDIIESLKLGYDGAALRRAKLGREKLELDEARSEMQSKRADEHYARKQRLQRRQYENERRLVKAGEKKTG